LADKTKQQFSIVLLLQIVFCPVVVSVQCVVCAVTVRALFDVCCVSWGPLMTAQEAV